ncbi:MAG: ATP-binding protein [Chloroflexota bacterium]
MDDSNVQIDQILDRSQFRQLPLFTIGIGLLFIGYAIAQQLILRERNFPIMVWFAVGCAVFIFSLPAIARRMESPEKHANVFIGSIAIAVLSSTLLRLYATLDPKQSANLILFMVAAGAVFVSRKWFLSLLALTLGGWSIYALFMTPIPSDEGVLIFWFLVLFSSGLTAIILHLARARVVLRSVEGEVSERIQKVEVKELASQLTTSAGVGHRITSILEKERLLKQITALIQENYQIHYAAVYLPEQQGLTAQLSLVAESGEWLATSQTPDTNAFFLDVLGVYQNGMITGMDESTPRNQFYPKQVTMVRPLKMANQRLGVLALQSRSKSSLTDSDQQVFQLLADQISVALENARLYEQITEMNMALEQKVQERTRELQIAYAKLERLDKTKSDFITIASHELKTPLTLINVYNQMFLSDDKILDNEAYRKWTENIDSGATRLNEIVERMEDVAMIDSQSLDLYMAPLSLSFLFASIKSNLRASFEGREISFSLNALGELPEIEGDTVALEKAFLQILTNSIKYTPNGGAVAVNGRFHPADESKTDSVELIISDSGVGIAPELKELIFEKFYQSGDVKLHSSSQTAFKGGGAGIGLAIAKGIVEAHEGQIWVESQGFDEESLPGSHFHVILPLRQSESTASLV